MGKKPKRCMKAYKSKKEQEAYRRVIERCDLPNGFLPDGLQRAVALEMYMMDMQKK